MNVELNIRLTRRPFAWNQTIVRQYIVFNLLVSHYYVRSICHLHSIRIYGQSIFNHLHPSIVQPIKRHCYLTIRIKQIVVHVVINVTGHSVRNGSEVVVRMLKFDMKLLSMKWVLLLERIEIKYWVRYLVALDMWTNESKEFNDRFSVISSCWISRFDCCWHSSRSIWKKNYALSVFVYTCGMLITWLRRRSLFEFFFDSYSDH